MTESAAEPPSLTTAEIRALRARAHALKPVVMVGAAGVSDAVLLELDGALSHHELVKVRFLAADHEALRDGSQRICERLGAVSVQRIGRICVYYRPRPEDPAPRPAAGARSTRRAGARRRQM